MPYGRAKRWQIMQSVPVERNATSFVLFLKQKKMTPTEAGVRELCANTRENKHLHLDLRFSKHASADVSILTVLHT
ncbi:hypothetical protein A0E43_11025 [Pectobacterium cacticida]